MAGAAEDFDRSFEFFEKQQKAGTTREKDVSFCDEFGGGIALDTTFESNLFEFSVDECSLQDDHTENRSTIFSDDIFEQYQETTVQVAVHEQLSAMYDDFSQEGAITVTGSIHVKTPKVTPFTLVLRDEAHIVQRVEVFVASEVCELLQDGAVGGDRQLRVNLHESQSNEEILIAKYFCLPTLRPVPLLVKSRVSPVKGFARVGFKVRANPNNEHCITKIVLMLAIPPNADGENCKMSRKGGTWEELKRTLTWCVDSLEPGEALEIQTQFPLLEEIGKLSKFPILVRCDYPSLFSNVELSTKGKEIQMMLNKSGRVIHRLV